MSTSRTFVVTVQGESDQQIERAMEHGLFHLSEHIWDEAEDAESVWSITTSENGLEIPGMCYEFESDRE